MEIGEELRPSPLVVSREQLVRYAGAADDYNPIHYDDAAAQSFGLPGVIVHGMLNMGLMTHYVLDQLPAGSQVVSFTVRFRSMVVPDQPIRVSARVRSLKENLAEFEVQLFQSGDKAAVAGRMRVQVSQ